MAIAFPTALDTDATLHQLANNLASALGGAYTSPGTTLDLADASAFPSAGGVIYVGGERGTYTGKTGNQLTGVADIINNYASGTTVEQLLDASHHNDLKDAIKALEAKVGIDASADATSLDYKVAQKEPAANKAINFGIINDTLYPSVQAVKTYADGLVVGLLDDRGNYDASVNTWPAAGGSGASGAILKGDLWYINVAGTLGGTAVAVGDTIRALVDAPAQVASNWSVIIAPASVAGQINAATSKPTPADTDALGLVDSALKKITWANLKAALLSTWKDATDGLVGMTLFKINFKNTANTFTSFFTNSNTASRTYTFKDRDGTIADLGANTFSGAQVNGITVLTSSAASIAINLAANNNFGHTTTENTTLGAPSNVAAGQIGMIIFVQGATPRTLAYNPFWKFPGGTIPALTATANAIDVLTYHVLGTSVALCQLIKDVK